MPDTAKFCLKCGTVSANAAISQQGSAVFTPSAYPPAPQAYPQTATVGTEREKGLISLYFILILIGLFSTLILSLLLTFAVNTTLPEYISKGWQLLFFNSAFFQDQYKDIGDIASVIFLFYMLVLIGAFGSVLAGLISTKLKIKNIMLNITIVAICYGYVMVILAAMAVILPTIMYSRSHFSYSTEYFGLLIPLTVTLIVTIFAKVSVRHRMTAEQSCR